MNDIAVHIENVSKQFGANDPKALNEINAHIQSGNITGLVGPDGAGKTTLIRLITGLLIPSSGAIRVFGRDTIKEANAIHDVTGYMPQKFGLYEDLTVLENLQLYAKLRGVAGQEKKIAFERMLTFTDLAPFTSRLAGDLSGGMKQKLGLACALLCRPKLLLLDEPSVGVDPVSRRELWRMVQELVQEGIAVVWSTAYLDEAERCGSVILLNEGKVLFNGTPEAMTQRVDGRVFQIEVAPLVRRQVLKALQNRSDVIDGVVQGQKIRVVMRPENDGLTNFIVKPVKPRFEDAFMDILGGGPGGDSVLAGEISEKVDHAFNPIEAQNLTKKFGDFTAAKNINFTIRRGEIFGLLGPNGAGKSTTFKMLCGLLKPTFGNALVSGHDLKTATAEGRSRIGYMAQKFSLYGDLSVRQNLEFFSGIYGLTSTEQKEKVELMISLFELTPYLATNAKILPLGFKQRLALACAVMHEPDVLFLDEPTSGVDPITRREFWIHINGMVAKGVTIMVSTHFMDEAEYCDRVALIYRGENIATGTPDDLKQSVQSYIRPDPTLEDAFVELIRRYDDERTTEHAA
jgi:ABC-2 type transport system ATP-binding protein